MEVGLASGWLRPFPTVRLECTRAALILTWNSAAVPPPIKSTINKPQAMIPYMDSIIIQIGQISEKNFYLLLSVFLKMLKFFNNCYLSMLLCVY